MRIIFTNKPNPYYSDYRTVNMNYKLIQSSAIFEVRSQYGYSQRPLRMSAKQISLFSSSSVLCKKTKSLSSSLTKKMKSSSHSINNTLKSNKNIYNSSMTDVHSVCSINNNTSSFQSPNLIQPFRKIIVDSCNNTINNKSNSNSCNNINNIICINSNRSSNNNTNKISAKALVVSSPVVVNNVSFVSNNSMSGSYKEVFRVCNAEDVIAD